MCEIGNNSCIPLTLDGEILKRNSLYVNIDGCFGLYVYRTWSYTDINK